MGNKKHATCFATLLQNELPSDVARLTTLIKPVLHQIRLLTGLNVGGKTCDIAFQLVLQQCWHVICCPFFRTLRRTSCIKQTLKHSPEGARLKQVVQAVITGSLLLVTLLFLLLGVASIPETSCQTVDSGQVEDTRWSEVSSNVVKVNVFLLVVDYIV